MEVFNAYDDHVGREIYLVEIIKGDSLRMKILMVRSM